MGTITYTKRDMSKHINWHKLLMFTHVSVMTANNELGEAVEVTWEAPFLLTDSQQDDILAKLDSVDAENIEILEIEDD